MKIKFKMFPIILKNIIFRTDNSLVYAQFRWPSDHPFFSLSHDLLMTGLDLVPFQILSNDLLNLFEIVVGSLTIVGT